jgi:hypothetical protein
MLGRLAGGAWGTSNLRFPPVLVASRLSGEGSGEGSDLGFDGLSSFSPSSGGDVGVGGSL